MMAPSNLLTITTKYVYLPTDYSSIFIIIIIIIIIIMETTIFCFDNSDSSLNIILEFFCFHQVKLTFEKLFPTNLVTVFTIKWMDTSVMYFHTTMVNNNNNNNNNDKKRCFCLFSIVICTGWIIYHAVFSRRIEHFSVNNSKERITLKFGQSPARHDKNSYYVATLVLAKVI